MLAFNQKSEITVHLLGGAIMSSDGTGIGGGTNHLGQVFTGKGTDVYEGLVCVDGSVIPTALGTKPSVIRPMFNVLMLFQV